IMLTKLTARSSPSPGSAHARGGPGPPRRALRTSLGTLTLAFLAGSLLAPSSARILDENGPSKGHTLHLQYEAGGARWLESDNQELVHFVCEPGTPYVVSLDRQSLVEAGVAPETIPAFLEALREAVADWRAVLRCDRIRAELDSPWADTLVSFVPIDTPGTLAVGTRAEHIQLNASRSWFPGSKRRTKYGDHGRSVSFYWVVAHELGHVWGLAHSESPDSLMYPRQCEGCRWSSFEQAAGNLIHAAGLVPDWSRPYYANRFFVKTPLAVIPRLLTGELPDEPLWSAVAEQCQGELCTSTPGQEPGLSGGLTPEPIPRSSLLGPASLLGSRSLDLGHLRASRMSATPCPTRSVPLPPGPAPGLASQVPADMAALAPRSATAQEELRAPALLATDLSDF
ncbi:MAG: matrixin family metalloprotease, partial [Polyangia bacterium]|nr:matrixin family metalloprotease [Polyangia bacterium]